VSKLRVLRGWNAIFNVHERGLPIPLATAERLLESLSSDSDLLWPCECWPPMVLERGLAPGSSGGHSKVRYAVSEHVAGRRVEFEFGRMAHLRTFRGRHYFEVLPRGTQVILRHTIDVETDFPTWVYWKVFVEQVHDALLEDAFDKAERSAGLPRPHRSRWSARVRFLRWLRARPRAPRA
jgi:hypothetical protein